MPTSRLVPGRFPAPGVSPVADKIRERRGSRGLTPLDGTLLHVPPIAEGWNSLLGAVRTKGNIPGDIRELMILRVAARNHAAFEWIHHEHVGRESGLTTEQLYLIRDTTALPTTNDILSPLQSAALAFADYSTSQIHVPPKVLSTLGASLRSLTDDVDDLLVECAAITSTYNMVSRFLVSLDVAAMSDTLVPWPATTQSYKVPIPNTNGHYLYVQTHVTHPSAPWIVCCNSLLTNTTMWQWALPYMLGPQPEGASTNNNKFLGKYNTYNVLLHDQRGHGQSSYPGQLDPSSQEPLPDLPCTIPLLASDIAHIIQTLHTLPSPPITEPIQSIHAVIGVSQGGAVALSFASQFPELLGGVVSCDTGPKTPVRNKQAWGERIELARPSENQNEKEGMTKLADVTVPRWFPVPSRCSPSATTTTTATEERGWEGIESRKTRAEEIKEMIISTPFEGFRIGAGALSNYDLINPDRYTTDTETETGTGTDDATDGFKGKETQSSLLDSDIPTLLIAGNLDGGGQVAEGMEKLRGEWNERRKERQRDDVEVELKTIKGSGHLPMVDETEEWWRVVGGWLNR